jgi:hypothetical protein
MRKLQKISILINTYPSWSNLHYDRIRCWFGMRGIPSHSEMSPEGRSPQMDNPSDLMLVDLGHCIADGRGPLHTSGFAGMEACSVSTLMTGFRTSPEPICRGGLGVRVVPLGSHVWRDNVTAAGLTGSRCGQKTWVAFAAQLALFVEACVAVVLPSWRLRHRPPHNPRFASCASRCHCWNKEAYFPLGGTGLTRA